jgi:hypothetical protein
MGKPWVPYVVQQGDHLRKLAFRHGATPEAVWRHATNSDLAKRRKNMDTLSPGDVLHLPSEPPPPLELRAKTSNRYRATVPTVPVHVHLDANGASLSGQPFEVHGFRSGDPLTGTVPESGAISIDVPLHVREIEIVLPRAGIKIPLSIGDLDPIEEQSGVVQRLHNMGYLPGGGDVEPDVLASALRAFQKDHGVAQTGTIDEATRRALEAQNLT